MSTQRWKVTFEDGTVEELSHPPGDYQDKETNFAFRGQGWSEERDVPWHEAFERAKKRVEEVAGKKIKSIV